MLLATNELLELPVMSLQTGNEIGITVVTILDRGTLQILAYELAGKQLDMLPAYLKIEDIRELSDIGFIVDSSEEIITLDDIVVAKDAYTHPLRLEHMRVVDELGTKLGKVERAIMNTDSFRVEQLHVQRPFFKSLSDTNLIIHRQQIVDIDDKTITVKSGTVKTKERPKPLEKQPFVNPFRGPSHPQPESAKSTRR